MAVVDALHGGAAAAVADDLFGGGPGGADLQAFFDQAALEVKASDGGDEEREEELEWLSNKDAFPTLETMEPAGARPRTKGVRRPRWVVAWSPPRAPAAGWRCRHCETHTTPQRRDGPEGRRTLCNACGVRYRSGRLVPEYRPASSPTFSPELHSNRHRRVVELRRRREEAAHVSLVAAGNGEEGKEELELLPKKDAFPAVDKMAPALQRSRTKGGRRPRRVVTWSPPPPPRGPAAAGRWGGGPVGEEELEWLSNKDASPTIVTMPQEAVRLRTKGVRRPRRVVASSPPCCGLRWRRRGGTEKTPRWREGPEGRSTLCNACSVRDWSNRMVPEYRPLSSPTFSPELHSSSPHRVVEPHRRREEGKEELEWLSNKNTFPAEKVMAPAGARPQTKGVRRPRRVVALSPPRRRSRRRGAAAAVEQGRVPDGGDDGADGSAAAGEERALAPGVTGVESASRPPAGRRCRHCGTEKTPQWREGPEGRRTLCNACGMRYKSGRLVPEYRPASSPTFSPGLHSNLHHQVVELRRRRQESTEASPAASAAAAAGNKWRRVN